MLSLPSALGTETPSPLASLPGKGICALASAETQGRLAAATASEPCSSRRNPMELNFEQKWEVERAWKKWKEQNWQTEQLVDFGTGGLVKGSTT